MSIINADYEIKGVDFTFATKKDPSVFIEIDRKYAGNRGDIVLLRETDTLMEVSDEKLEGHRKTVDGWVPSCVVKLTHLPSEMNNFNGPRESWEQIASNKNLSVIGTMKVDPDKTWYSPKITEQGIELITGTGARF